MKQYDYAHLIWQLNSLQDTGKYDGITICDVKKHIEAGTVSSYMIDTFGDDADFSTIGAEHWLVITEDWQNLANAVDEERKMGIKNRGLCLLLGYCFQRFDRLKES
jgi:hypothetical protein